MQWVQDLQQHGINLRDFQDFVMAMSIKLKLTS